MTQLLLTFLFCGTLFAEKPNILMILADDMGYSDLGCTGSTTIKTPHIDGLAERGILCKQGYVPSSVCSPSRAGILTGRDPRRFGYEGNLNKGGDSYPTRHDLQGLPVSEHTLADHLKAVGYATALVGKWHQGTTAPFHPNVRGFDHFYGMLNGGHDYFPTAEKNNLQENGQPLTEFSSSYITDLFTDEAIKWIGSQEKETPWFLFASYNAPHTPMQATEKDLALYSHIQNKTRRTYAAMMHALDRGVGRLVSHLEESGELENTLIVFFSDNGGATNNGSWNGPFAGRKGSLREGGTRVPFLISWPAMLPQGQTYQKAISALDLLPTFMAAANSEPLPLKAAPSHEDARNRRRASQRYGDYDGQNLLPKFLTNDDDSEERLLFWRLQGQSAVLSGDRKLVKLSHRPAQLFAPATDLGERDDLANEETEVMAELFRLLGEWESSLATVPLWDSSPHWNADSARIYDTPPSEEPK
ncbi:MAG: sulfatase-like hydrolase/transferase [Roseibacillus sp.]